MIARGTIIAGRYQLESKIGAGGMGAVWRAHHLELGSDVAVKLIEGGYLSSRDGRARFRREAKLAASLRSPYVVQVFDYGVDGDVPYLVMELLEGESLAGRLHRAGPMRFRELVFVMSQLARAISKAHEMGIVHRDLKPENIFLARFDDEVTVKVLDFGVAKATSLEVSAGTASKAMLGTVHYMSPEQAHGAGHVDFRSDLWSMGIVAYECLVGTRPFEGTGLGEVLVQIMTMPNPVPSEHAPVPIGFDRWFSTACAKNPGGRFASATEMVEDLVELQHADDETVVGAPFRAPTPQPLAPIRRPTADERQQASVAAPQAPVAGSAGSSPSTQMSVAQTTGGTMTGVSRRKVAIAGGLGVSLVVVIVLGWVALRSRQTSGAAPSEAAAPVVAVASAAASRATPAGSASSSPTMIDLDEAPGGSAEANPPAPDVAGEKRDPRNAGSSGSRSASKDTTKPAATPTTKNTTTPALPRPPAPPTNTWGL